MTSLAKVLVQKLNPGVNLSRYSFTLKNSIIPTIQSLHTSSSTFKADGPKKWLTYNELVTPPITDLSERPPAWVCHMRTDIKYSPKKMWYVAAMIRGMSVDEAIKQLTFLIKKPAAMVIETIKEAQEMAVRDHNVEYKSNLWIAESFTTRSQYIRGYRKHARGRMGRVEYKFCHYFVRLEEGSPPEDYYQSPQSSNEKLTEFITELRDRRIIGSL